jgi:geranylgeranyl diphosphate synthase type I
MDKYEAVLNLLSNLIVDLSWEELNSALKRFASRRPVDWKLPFISCEAVGGKPEQAVPGAAAIACLQISIILVDDMLDADPRGEYHGIGMAAAANLGVAFQAVGLDAVNHSKAALSIILTASRALNRMIMTTAYGQHLDTQNPGDEAAYWHLVQTKSSPFFGAALYVGALLGGAEAEVAEKIKSLGRIYGEIIQIHDDLQDTMAVPANPDWTLGRSPLPILYAQIVDHPEKERFSQLRWDITDPVALAEAQNILVRCGAVSYSMDQILGRYRKAQKILETTSVYRKEGLQALLDGVIEPVKKLFVFAGVQPPIELSERPGIAQ